MGESTLILRMWVGGGGGGGGGMLVSSGELRNSTGHCTASPLQCPLTCIFSHLQGSYSSTLFLELVDICIQRGDDGRFSQSLGLVMLVARLG